MRAARRLLLPLLLVLVGVLLAPAAGTAAPRSALPGTLHLQMVPPIRGVPVAVDGNTARSDAHGRVNIKVRNFLGLDQRLKVGSAMVTPDRRVVLDRFRGSVDHGVRDRIVEVGLRTVRRVSWRYIDRFESPVPVRRVTSMRLRSNTGEIVEVAGDQLAKPLWLAESRTQQGPRGLTSKHLYYVVDAVMVDGTSVVNRAGQKFVPWDRQSWVVQLLFFKVSFTASDMFFPRRAGDGIQLTRADGRVQRLPFGPDGTVLVPDLPRGTYTLTVRGGGLSFGRPVSISRDQEVMLTVISVVDLTLVAVGVLGVAVGLVLLGRPHLRRPFRMLRLRARRPGRRRWRPRAAAGLVLVLATAAVASLPAIPARAAPDAAASPTAAAPASVPVLAYYYIWFNPTSWNRAKSDYPVLGRYSSDDQEIMRRHVRMAKAAGITGFLVSWKHTEQLDERLAALVEVARAESFRLGIVYQGIDFSRKPLPLATVRADLALFADRWAADPVFGIFDQPVVIWNGSDRYSATEVADTVRQAQQKLQVLGTAKSVSVVNSQSTLDGQAYYWSSADPLVDRSRDKLAAMSRAVRLRGGLWIAPVSPGFDARQIGGRREVPRRDGETLRASFAAARLSQPNALGIISWNEFTENTYVEPSEEWGSRYLEVLADLLGVAPHPDAQLDSSAEGDDWGLPAWAALILGIGAVVLVPLWTYRRRRRRRAAATPPAQRGAARSEEAPLHH
ncbi:hypothetical protein [Micromonospora robiginosa]|uniref:Glycosyl hydrolase family 99 n=1 Tax=Micromonospora robiginosa TaxID=2749844 RepID=A0A7L6BBW4_9ACTN|nr:hypothetical protein [Micromonospora ferruginea]QLQ39452.1 hypothetical protein H1D33_11835 [Micromonospora ferruginea]